MTTAKNSLPGGLALKSVTIGKYLLLYVFTLASLSFFPPFSFPTLACYPTLLASRAKWGSKISFSIHSNASNFHHPPHAPLDHVAMFAVPGWSVSADKLKSEVAGAPANAAEPNKSKKRKRQPENVTSSNVADLWERVIEHKAARGPKEKSKSQSHPGEKQDKKASKKGKKRQKSDSASTGTDSALTKDAAKEATAEPVTPLQPQGKSAKKGKKVKQSSNGDKSGTKEAADATAPQTSLSKPAASARIPAPPKLTPLQASMREKLISARFRHLNETLYTRPSADAFSLFDESPDMFTEYHEGFRRQVEVWPENPVEGYLADVRQRGRARFSSKDSQRHKKPQKQEEQQDEPKGDFQPLPRNRATGICTIADLGCGDARLASELQSEKKKLKLDILSFDLHSPHPLVTKADIANLPVANGTVDVAIFCLALMGTNWIDFIEEAYRILRWKGELWVAEIKSRFGHVSGGGKKNAVVDHSVGKRRNAGAAGTKKNAGNKATAAAADETTLLVEVDGVDDNRQQTDVSAFVRVLNQRGFVLVGQDQGPAAEAIDLSNKMFVKMRFLKAAPALKGKCVRPDGEENNGKSRLGGRLPAMAKKPRFLDANDEADDNEAAVLKPCVYKIR